MTQDRSNPPVPPGGKRIDVVVKGSALLADIQTMLATLPHTVSPLGTEPMIEEIAASGPDLLIVELGFLQLSRWQLLARLRATPDTAAIPILLISENEDLLRQAHATEEQFGAHLALLIPCEPEAFVQAVQDLLGRQAPATV